MLGGHIDLAAGNPLEFLPYIESGMVRPLGIMRPTRLAALPQVATLAEQGLEAEPFQMWRGIALPGKCATRGCSLLAGRIRARQPSPALATFTEANLGTPQPTAGTEHTAFLEKQEAFYRTLLPTPGTN